METYFSLRLTAELFIRAKWEHFPLTAIDRDNLEYALSAVLYNLVVLDTQPLTCVLCFIQSHLPTWEHCYCFIRYFLPSYLPTYLQTHLGTLSLVTLCPKALLCVSREVTRYDLETVRYGYQKENMTYTMIAPATTEVCVSVVCAQQKRFSRRFKNNTVQM